jgi:hypothetical protein
MVIDGRLVDSYYPFNGSKGACLSFAYRVVEGFEIEESVHQSSLRSDASAELAPDSRNKILTRRTRTPALFY